jgi:hypothetical protein
MSSSVRRAALAAAVTTAAALPASALAHQTVVDPRGVAVTMHVLPGDEPQAGQPATIVIVQVKPPKKGRFTFGRCGCHIKVTTAAGRVLLDRATGKRTSFVFPDSAAYEITYSGSYRAKGGKTRRFSTTFAIRAN